MKNPYFQFSGGIFAVLLFMVCLFFVFVFLPISIVAEAFSKLGLTPAQGVLMFIAILVGRVVNLPVYTSERLVVVPRPRSMGFSVDEFGRPVHLEEEPANELKKQVFAMNVGGCILPVLLSITFLLGMRTEGHALESFAWIGFALLMVTGGCFALSKADPFTGLRVPLFMPALMTFISVFFFVPEPFRPVAAYVAGTLGTLLGGNLLPLLLPRIRNSVGAPLVSIGGAGTFGGVFIAGILAVLLA
ncbi:DUF1614 domain-containing protein [Pseudodesulfovibrio piezophilus]|uniref:DUF1614 domain-containing protein n=1 Tax=Pseudodesulfovibrio piezophilus (strain DSM 21447 / JCM 15486 / C1TLV30) TaxID=1322246 RepID=M1WJ61_PSEP2|nr:DUF1614 domain-containing protein [Pseudodesulfovibrio piezophilus]CCH47336.1 conserved membrane protein of unknown function [Pseudodesulfovibrio piezophilus C1TLV30]